MGSTSLKLTLDNPTIQFPIKSPLSSLNCLANEPSMAQSLKATLGGLDMATLVIVLAL